MRRRRRRPPLDAQWRQRLVVLAMKFTLNLLPPVAPAGLSFQLEHFLGQFLALFGRLSKSAGFLDGQGGSRDRERGLAFAQRGTALALGCTGNGRRQFLFPIVVR